ncbi:probable BOI-related E3 ubiquitin-protein ligase 3 [Diospyros lotus]|uniref:probable BOI-related E3 ubiquitin-protein ligase 3 n=1 Tax=Diospyros lotus TaxID=55363 RepID=UPI00225B955D|nr:probable BOI-related E3 ubiquitin-protein ligase 3 [Diospyros lotus]
MAMPQQHNQFHQQAKTLRNMYNIEAQIPPPVAYFNGSNLPDHQPQHPPYIPPFHVVGFAPGPAPDRSDGLRPPEQDFLESNSQISSVDFLQARSVSTGLGLSLDNGRLVSSGESPFLGLIGNDYDRELQRQDAEIDKFLKVQGDRFRQEVLEKVQANQLRTLSYVEKKALEKFSEKEAQLEDINEKNVELELRIEQLAVEASAWKQRARLNENMISTLKFNLQHVYAQSRDSKERCGNSEVDDTASCCNGRASDFHLCKENIEKGLMTCKVCRVNEVCMLLLPCKHLCLCRECEIKFSFCPLCQSSKIMGLEVYM